MKRAKHLIGIGILSLLLTICAGMMAFAENYDIILPEGSSRYYTEDEIAGWSAQTVCYAKNEIYAMHGWIFRSEELAGWFENQGWYTPSVTSSGFSQSMLNDFEKKNAQLLQKRENALIPGGYQLDRPGYNYDLVYADLYGIEYVHPDGGGQTADGVTAESSGYIIPDSDSYYLTSEEIRALSWQELCYARNEIYARHGRLFQSAELSAYFATKSWYYGYIRPADFSDSVFNDYERKNIDALLRYERSTYGDYPLDSGSYSFANVRSLGGTANSASENEYIFPQSSSRYLTDSEVSGMTARFLCYAKNEIYARHGRQFKSRELQDYFNQKSWYYGYIPADTFDNSTLNKFEVANAELLQRYEYMYAPGGYQLQ